MKSAAFRPSAFTAACILLASNFVYGQNPAVLTAEYDNARTTANNNEILLTPATVHASTFGKLGAYALDGQVVGQPLYVPGAHIGKSVLNALFVGTMNNTVYALDADHPGAAPLWQVNLGPAVPVNYAGTCPANFATGGQLGILSTPVIDGDSKTLYVVAANPVPQQAAYLHTLYALDLNSGKQVHGGAVVINASVAGSGSSSSGGVISLGRANLIQRPALLLSNQNVYVGFSSCGPDPTPYHGWVIGYQAGNIQKQTMIYNATPNGDEGGIWQAGRGLVGNSAGSILFETGNGTADGVTDFGESFVKLAPQGTVQDWFTPSNVQMLSDNDLDLSTTSPLLTPDTNLLIGGGKQGLVYVLNGSALGRNGSPVQTFFGTSPCDANNFNGCQKIHSLAYWQNQGTSKLYVWGTNDTLRSFSYQNGSFGEVPDSQGSQLSGYPGGILTVTSAVGAPATGIVWALTPGEFHAYTATNVGDELWNSNMVASRDALGGNFHFEQFTVVNGKAFVPDNQRQVVVYGLLPH